VKLQNSLMQKELRKGAILSGKTFIPKKFLFPQAYKPRETTILKTTDSFAHF